MREFLFVFQDVDVACGRSAGASEHVADDQRFPQPTAYAPRAARCRPSALQTAPPSSMIALAVSPS